MTPTQLEIAKIFMPHAIRKMDRIKNKNIRFAHYTSAEAGLEILRSKSVLLRHSSVMNDFSEIKHGLSCLQSSYDSPLGKRLNDILKSIQDDLPQVFKYNFDQNLLDIMKQTYLISISEHDDPEKSAPEEVTPQRDFGKLSMWRAYAPKNGVAFILNNTAFIGASDALGAYTSPVIYRTPETYRLEFEEVINLMEKNIDLLKDLGGKNVHDILQNTLRYSIQSTKHPSFEEEKEWRIIYSPQIANATDQNNKAKTQRIKLDVKSIKGVPQKIYSIPLEDYPNEGFIGATIPDLVNKILIGPTPDGFQIWEAYVEELDKLGVSKPDMKVEVTGIPLRVS